MRLPRLHVVTNDDVLGRPDFTGRARALLRAHGAGVALHLRSAGMPVRKLFDLARTLSAEAAAAGGRVLVNDRVDVALAVDPCGVQLGARSLPVQAARGLLGTAVPIGYSAHDAAEAASALGSGADFVLLGTVWATASHPGRPGAGTELVREAARLAAGPVVAIGGVTPERTVEAVEAGAYGVAVIRGVWSAADPVASAGAYLEAMEVGT